MMKLKKMWLVVAMVWMVGCSEGEEEEDVASFTPWERPAEFGEMRWYGGDLHVHAAGASNDTPRESTPERIAEVARERGLDFVVLTDHSNSTGSDPWTTEEDPELFNQGPEFPYRELVEELSDDEFLMVQGNEISPRAAQPTKPNGHIGCIPSSLDGFRWDVVFVDRPMGSVTGAEVLTQALEAGCWAIVNHPYGVNWISYDWTAYDYDGMEVWNGGLGFSELDEKGVKAWACDLASGRKVVAIGASDNHKVEQELPGGPLDPALGEPRTFVWSSKLEWDAIMSGLSAGQVAVSDTGVPLEIDIFDEQGRWLAMNGGEVSADEGRVVRLRGARKRSGEDRVLELLRVSRGGCEDTRVEEQMNVPEPNWEVVGSWSIGAREEFEEQVEVELVAGDVLFAWMVPTPISTMGRDVAISGALFVQ